MIRRWRRWSPVGGAGQVVAHARTDPLVDQARSVEAAKIGQDLAGQGRVAHDVGRPGAEPDLHQVAVGGQARTRLAPWLPGASRVSRGVRISSGPPYGSTALTG